MSGPHRWTLADATPADAGAIGALERRIFLRPWSQTAVLAEIAFGHSAVVARSLGAGPPIAGYIFLRSAVQEIHIMKIAVEPSLRRGGIATRLLQEGLRRCREDRSLQVFLEVRPSNAPAREFYRKMGFACIGVRPGYYPESGEDALVLARRLDSADRAPYGMKYGKGKREWEIEGL
jgi:ribosomal-protein-alanine N-acetyltransferase